jgi:DNA-binding NtrC family response regulator
LLVAEINARRGLISGAATHLEIARGLLKKFENFWQQGRLAIICSAVAVLQSDYDAALRHNKDALACANRSGSREIRLPALANLVAIQLAQKRLAEGKQTLTDLLKETSKNSPSIVEVGVRDLEMALAIAEGDFERAAEIESSITGLLSKAEASDSYYELWHQLTRVRWLYLQNEPLKGLAIAAKTVPRIQRTSDRNLLLRMRLLEAEGLGRVDQKSQAASLVASAIDVYPDWSLEMMAETYRVIGRLISSEDPVAAVGHLDRAIRILQSIGNLTASAEVERDKQEVITNDIGACKDVDQRTPIAGIVERVTAVVEMGAHPPLLAREAASLLIDANAVAHAVVEAGDDSVHLLSESPSSRKAQRSRNPAELRIPVGSFRNQHYHLAVTPYDTASARSTVLSIGRLIHAAVCLASARQQEKEQSALWPVKTQEEELGLICASDRTRELVKTIRRVANSNVTVLLTGETGVGKEIFARAVHQSSARSDRTFLPFNCSTVPRDMLDSQLFGHKRGSFTGALNDAPGMIRSANGGTLFLDEIGEMAIETQPKLLRFLESGEILPLGEAKPILVDVRIVAATNANLDQLLADGRFREDLYYRLNVIRINIPPLRERREEIPALVEHFLEKFGRELQKPMLRIADETLEYLVLYRWPGNVRQLANEIRRLVAMAEPGAVLMPAHLSDDIAASRRTVPANTSPRLFNEVIARIDQPLSAVVEHVERAAIQRALSMTDGRLDEAAKMLGLSRKGLYLKRQRLNLG